MKGSNAFWNWESREGKKMWNMKKNLSGEENKNQNTLLQVAW